jgi:hypothetical protein
VVLCTVKTSLRYMSVWQFMRSWNRYTRAREREGPREREREALVTTCMDAQDEKTNPSMPEFCRKKNPLMPLHQFLDNSFTSMLATKID